jgi:hypothetical protein
MPRIRTPHRNQDPIDPGTDPQDPSATPVPTPKKSSSGWGKVKWALGGIAIGILGAIGYDLYQKGKKTFSSDDGKPQGNPSPHALHPGGFGGGGTHTTVVGMPMPQLYPVPAPMGNPSHWSASRNDFSEDDDSDLYEKAQKIAERNAKRRREKLDSLIQKFEDGDD